jgi:hypothetical protein
MQGGEPILNFLLITFLGLLIAFSPSLIIVNLLLALKSRQPIRDTLILVAGAAIPLIIIGIVGALLLKPDSALHIRDSIPDINVPPLIELLFGISLIGYAGVRYFRPPNETTKHPGMANKTKNIITNPGSIFSFGLARSALSFTNLLAVLVICKTIVIYHTRPILAFFALSWAIIVGVAPLLAAPFLYKYHPRVLRRTQARIDRILSHDNAPTINIILIIIGLVFLIHGTNHLSEGP